LIRALPKDGAFSPTKVVDLRMSDRVWHS
jgi:hypothetical protein